MSCDPNSVDGKSDKTQNLSFYGYTFLALAVATTPLQRSHNISSLSTTNDVLPIGKISSGLFMI